MRSPIGFHISLWWGTSIANNLRQIMELTSRASAEALEINPAIFLDKSPAERRELRNMADAFGLQLSVNGSMNAATDISSLDPAIREAGIDWCKQVIDAMSDMEISHFSGCIYAVYASRLNQDQIKTEKPGICARSAESMNAIVRYATENGVTCCLEILNRYEQFLINTVDEGLDYCRAVNHDGCMLLLDLFHMSIEEDNLSDAIINAHANNRLGYIHVGESNRRIPTGGRSNINWSEVSVALKKCNYRDLVIIEPFELSTTHNASRVCVWRNHENPNDLIRRVAKAKEGVEFMRRICP